MAKVEIKMGEIGGGYNIEELSGTIAGYANLVFPTQHKSKYFCINLPSDNLNGAEGDTYAHVNGVVNNTYGLTISDNEININRSYSASAVSYTGISIY
jgi:hypothetical protein